MRKLKCVLLILIFPVLGFSQENENKEHEINRSRISLDVGFPNIVGLSGEYILPFVSNHFSINADITYLPNFVPNSKTTISYYSLGSNIYFNKKGKGLYFGFGYGHLPIRTTEIENKKVDISVDFSIFNSKLGLKIGTTAFIKFEIGYSMMFYNIEEANYYMDETYGLQINPTIDFLHLMNGKIGFGYSF
ncbi:MAG: hypothetical protein ACI9U0_001884 [Flavobacteriales bacterium]|jgi:hypothetical protein|tara:strand:+ start:800 stop:1369 length:570 start_codon:yes stop_codon:yes gene_type:complete